MKWICTFYLTFFISIGWSQTDIHQMVEHDYAQNGKVKIHYVTMGSGPLILFVHGFPDFWYTWRNQMLALSDRYQVAAVDLRGYNKSDSPPGVENYFYEELTNDLAAVIRKTGHTSAYIVGHDWGAAISWRLAINQPQLVKKLVAISVPHPKAGNTLKFIENKPEPSYADHFVTREFEEKLTENWLAGWVKDADAKSYYIGAFQKSDKKAMINYYKANFPTSDNLKNPVFLERSKEELPNVKVPVLIIHGKQDPYIPVSSHNNTWDHIDSNLTIEILTDAGHFVQQDSGEKLTELIDQFLKKK